VDKKSNLAIPIIDSGIKGSRWELFEESSHLAYVEEAAKYQRVINEFLDLNC